MIRTYSQNAFALDLIWNQMGSSAVWFKLKFLWHLHEFNSASSEVSSFLVNLHSSVRYHARFSENEISTWSEINFSRVYRSFIFGYSYLVILESKAFQQLNILKDLCELSGCFWYLSFLNILWLHCLYIRNLCHWCPINTN